MGHDEDLFRDHPDLNELDNDPNVVARSAAAAAAAKITDAVRKMVNDLVNKGIEPLVRTYKVDRAQVYRSFADYLRRLADSVEEIGERPPPRR